MFVKEPIPGVVYPPRDRLRKYVEAGALPTTSLVEELMRSFARNADRTALFTAEGTVTYAELDRTTDRFAAALHRLGLRPLDRALFQSGNSKELVFAIVGCLKAGIIPVCTLAAHRESEITYLGCHSDARLHIVQGDDPKNDLLAFALATKRSIPTLSHLVSLRGAPTVGARRFEDLVAEEDPVEARRLVARIPRDAFQVLIFQLSGGTTGTPKIIARMQNDYLLNAQLTIETLGFRETDVTFMPMPIIHNACMICFLFPSLLAGAAFVIPADMSAQSWGAAFRAAKPTFLGLIRPLFPRLEAMLEQRLGTLDSVRACWSPDGAKAFREKYGVLSYGMFGMSEGLNMYTRADDPLEARDWTVGRPISPFDEVRVVEPGTDRDVGVGEVGELLARGPYTVSGYYNAPDRNRAAFTEDGFYRTGDLIVKRALEGEYFYAFAGRTKDVVDRGSEKINCEEVETALAGHRSVREVAVIGMPDAKLGERVCAYVVAQDERAPPTVDDLARHLKTVGLAKFKWPERVEIVAALAVTKVGKLDKAAMRADITRKLAAEGAADLRLGGVHHSARPTWRLKETVEFYRDVLGLPLVHAVSARGWGRERHPDFLHFFFDSGNGSTIAFFHYLGTEQPEHLVHRPHYDSDATHTAWRVETRDQLLAWRRRLEARGVPILYQIEHEVIESIYFRDPNGYFLEITRPLRPFQELDARDAEATLEAAISLDQRRIGDRSALTDIEAAWRAKGDLVRNRLAGR
jgi:non-ribosomal peptide synthetase component E (peptide arylation enzyme)/catechol 2,3-dioxygenase-like lactoylglutathione lyase family enzyme